MLRFVLKPPLVPLKGVKPSPPQKKWSSSGLERQFVPQMELVSRLRIILRFVTQGHIAKQQEIA